MKTLKKKEKAKSKDANGQARLTVLINLTTEVKFAS